MSYEHECECCKHGCVCRQTMACQGLRCDGMCSDCSDGYHDIPAEDGPDEDYR